MERLVGSIILINCLAIGQAQEPPPRFEIADVHISPKAVNAFVRSGPARGGRYEVKNATMVDLIRIAYGFDTDKILGGPNWLEMNRFDVRAKVPADSTPEAHKLMLQALLEDRFKLAVHKETKSLPTYALTSGKKPQLKEADGTEEPGCRPQSSSGPRGEGSFQFVMGNASGPATTFSLGPGMMIHYTCRNMTMAAFAGGLRRMFGVSVGTNDVLDETGLKGNWNFDVKWSMQFLGLNGAGTGDQVTLFEAVDKQLGLKLEERQIPTPVMVVDSVRDKPTDNPPGIAEALPVIPVPTEFEVASVKLADPNRKVGNFQMQTGGRFNAEGMPMRFLINRAFNTNNRDQVAGLPGWADTDRFDIIAKTASAGPSAPALDNDAVAPMIRALLVDRFKMTYHTEERPASAYSLVAGKQKMKKADPASRTWCKNAAAPAGTPPGSQVLTCQNISMAQFADRLQNMSQELNWPILDATGIEGGWDFALTFSRGFGMAGGGRGMVPAMAEGAVPVASEPTGAFTIFEAIEKQLGLKLEMRKRPMPVTVVDHIEQKPTEN